MISQYIKGVIDNHQKEYYVTFDTNHIEQIESYINKGVYAFQIIYIITEPYYSNFRYKIVEIKTLDHRKLKYKNRIWSYDDGVRYQWNEIETLVFDPRVIRNIKLEELNV